LAAHSTTPEVAGNEGEEVIVHVSGLGSYLRLEEVVVANFTFGYLVSILMLITLPVKEKNIHRRQRRTKKTKRH